MQVIIHFQLVVNEYRNQLSKSGYKSTLNNQKHVHISEFMKISIARCSIKKKYPIS